MSLSMHGTFACRLLMSALQTSEQPTVTSTSSGAAPCHFATSACSSGVPATGGYPSDVFSSACAAMTDHAGAVQKIASGQYVNPEAPVHR